MNDLTETAESAAHRFAKEVIELRAKLEQAEKDARRWIPVSERLPACDDERVYIGINSAGYVCCFNALDSRGQCVMESPESSVTQMSELTHWMPLPEPPHAEVPDWDAEFATERPSRNRDKYRTMKPFDNKAHAVRFTIALTTILLIGMVVYFWPEQFVWICTVSALVVCVALGVGAIFQLTRTWH